MKNTHNLADMPLSDVRELIDAWDDGNLPSDFSNRNVQLEYNPNSGNVFLTNDDGDCAMINPSNGELESHYFTPYGFEGFFDDLISDFDQMNDEDQEYVRQIAANLNREDELPPINEEEEDDDPEDDDQDEDEEDSEEE